MRHVLVLGAGGMAGHVVATYLRENGMSVDTLSATKKLDNETYLIDVTSKETLEAFLETKTYDAVVNCIGILVQQSEQRKDLSTYLNSYLPHFLEYFYRESPTKLIHLSTDCVFSGKNAPYNERSAYDGELFYDRTKALGEVINDKDLTFRMSIIGPDMTTGGIGLFNWFMQQNGNISGYSKAMWNGITTTELARGIQAAIAQDLTGLYHLVPEHNISKYDLLLLFKSVFNKTGTSITPSESVTIDKTLVNTRNDFDFKVRDYESMVKDMRAWIEHHPDLYKHYRKD